ncbi:MAG TPA: PAS domain-containing protein [Polyangium sp.]|nr:PAS domain-containing protein [Polyangium sp.]
MSTLDDAKVATWLKMADGMSDPWFFKDREHRWVAFNRAFCELLKRPREELLGKTDSDYFPPEQVRVFWEHDDKVIFGGLHDLNEESLTQPDGTVKTIWTRKAPVVDETGECIGLFGIIMDVSDHETNLREKKMLEDESEQQRIVIDTQAKIINSLSVPVLAIWKGIFLVPLVGSLSHGRLANAVERVLTEVSTRGTETVIMDVTGAGEIDVEIADLLMRAVKAIGLLGCETILVGIGPGAARTLVEGGADLGKTLTFASLEQGLAHALAQRRRKPAAKR